jgi:YfiH family protein
MTIMIELLTPDWPAPARVHALITTRAGGVSESPYDDLNLGDHVGDNPASVSENRRRLMLAGGLPRAPRWLAQVHGCTAVDPAQISAPCEADAAVTDRPSTPCAVLTADCLPLLVCNRRGDRVAAIHAGWRGLLDGVIETTLARFPNDDPLLVWLGPAIASDAFEVGEEVRQAFVDRDPQAETAFHPNPGAAGKWLADLYALARQRIAPFAPTFIGGGDLCTFSDPRFYSYRRDGVTGRFASLIWFE